MATATKVEIPQPKFKVVLELSQEEAQFLMDIVGLRITGAGRRNTCNNPIYDALKSVGLSADHSAHDIVGGLNVEGK